MIQWHPIFAELLRPLLEGYYDVQTNVPVGDLPREADIVLLRRTASSTPPFHGLWKELTTWNVLEFKGPSVSPRIGQLDLLIEVGLGIDRRLNSERLREKLRPLAPRAVSFWYLGNRLGKRFLDQANERLKGLAPYRQGVWRSEVLQRPVFLVSRLDLPIEQDTLPLHVVGQEPRETELAVARFLLEHPALWRQYRAWLAALHVSTWQEVRVMARTKGEELTLDLRPLIKTMGKQEFIRQLDARGVLEDLGKELLRKVGIHQFVKQLDAAERQELRRILLEEDA